MPPLTIAARAVVACLPVLLFLTTLVLLDTFRLVRRRRVAVALVAGGVTALATYFLNTWLLDLTDLPSWRFAVLVAPLVEETAKGAYVAWLIATRRAGFLVDTAILGFAVGAGFAIVENVYYLSQLPDAPLLVWAVRGLGTAIMHGGVTALLGLMVQAFGGTARGRLGPSLAGGTARRGASPRDVQPLHGPAAHRHGPDAGDPAGRDDRRLALRRAAPAALARARLRSRQRIARAHPRWAGFRHAGRPLSAVAA
ncbi:MAG: PrsW family intramembrane metalloprotease [bacterium]|nr:PrsW family intramembrane metalloprotease [bacterium]